MISSEFSESGRPANCHHTSTSPSIEASENRERSGWIHYTIWLPNLRWRAP